MFQARFHGRGGQGVVTAAELLAEAALRESRHAQAFPSFGSERMGAPVMSFCRIDDKPIRTHEPVTAAREPRRRDSSTGMTSLPQHPAAMDEPQRKAA